MKLINTIPPPVLILRDRLNDADKGKSVSFWMFLHMCLDKVPDWGKGLKNQKRAGALYDLIEEMEKENSEVLKLEDYEYEKLSEIAQAHDWGTYMGARFRPFMSALLDAVDGGKGPAGKQ